MRIILSETSVKALEELQDKFRSHNPNIEPSGGLFLNQLALTLNGWLSPRDIKGLANQLTSARIKRKQLQTLLGTIADKIADDALDEAEKALQRLGNLAPKPAENKAISAEKE